MPIFLTQDQVYRLLQRESPEDAYPDGVPGAFYSTADQYSFAKLVADAYASNRSIYDNFFPTTATDRLSDFEFMYFGYTQDITLGFTERKARLLQKIRTRRRTTPPDIKATVYTVISQSILVEIVEWGCGDNGWVLDVSQLGISTILNEFNGLEKTGPNLCQLDAADYGMTDQEFADLQAQAYTYDVRIYSYTLTADERARLEQVLNEGEPARSMHNILDGLDPADSIGGDT